MPDQPTLPAQPTLCACGCGQPVKPGNQFVNGHNARVCKPANHPWRGTSKRLVGKPLYDRTKASNKGVRYARHAGDGE